MEKEIAISKVVIKIGKHEEELTVDEARKLMAALQDLLGEDEKVIPQPYPVPYWPYWYRVGDWWYTTNKTWTGNSNTWSDAPTMTTTACYTLR